MRFKGPKKPAVAPLVGWTPNIGVFAPQGPVLGGLWAVLHLINPVCSWRCSSSAPSTACSWASEITKRISTSRSPTLGRTGTAGGKYREIDTRLKRLRWVNRELRKEYGGFKGAWNWLLGRGLPTGKELYSKMVDEADDMIMAMEERREVDILQEVMKYSGLEAGEH